MAQSVTAIYNLALSAISSRKLTSSPGENSREAEMCDLWYEPVRRTIFRAAHWHSLKSYSRLALLMERVDGSIWESDDPIPGWKYAYAAPGDMAAPRHLSNYQRFTTGVYEASSRFAVFCDVEDVILCYTQDRTDPTLWDNDLYLAVAFGLAAHICLPLTGKAARARDILAMANDKITQARVTSANEPDGYNDTLPEWIEARGYTGAPSRDRYISPYGNMLTMPGADVE